MLKIDLLYADLLIFNEYENRNVKNCFYFWIAGVMQSNHDWLIYKGIQK